MATTILNSEHDINAAVIKAKSFRINPTVTNLTINPAQHHTTITNPKCYEILADALNNSTSLNSIAIYLLIPLVPDMKGMERAVISVIDALRARPKLTSVTLNALNHDLDDNIVEAIGRFMKECRSLEKLDLSGIPILRKYLHCGMIAEGLALSCCLKELDLGYEPRDHEKPPRFQDNLNVLSEGLLENDFVRHHYWKDDVVRRRVLIIERHPKNAEPQRVNNNINGWSLRRKLTAAAQQIDNYNKSLATEAELFTKLGNSVDELKKQYQTLETQRQELQVKLTLITNQQQTVAVEFNSQSTKFSQMKTAREKMASDVTKLQQFVVLCQPELEKWKQKLQTNLNTWTETDVLFFLAEIEMSQHCPKFKQNNIIGVTLLALDTNDLMVTLDVPFTDAKKILMYRHLAQTMHDIYSIPNGPLQWDNARVLTWLNDVQMSHLKEIFKTRSITGAELVFLEKTDLTNHLQITSFSDVQRLQIEIAKLKESIGQDNHMTLDELNNNNQVQQNVPAAFLCPIKHEIMQDPVVASDGHTYERTAISLWLQNNNSSPMTGLQLSNKQLTPSHTLKSMIREFIDANKKK